MNGETKTIQTAVRREHAESYMLTFLVAFSAAVIATRVFLQLTGFPQIGNSVLHIAHALWGGLFLVAAVLLPLIYANRWALRASAVIGGLGVGLFIDEVGKFITQANDYFFPPAMPIIYGFALLSLLLYVSLRRPSQLDARKAMYCAIDGFKDLLDGHLNAEEADRIEAQLALAQQSGQRELGSLAKTLRVYLQEQELPISPVRASLWSRIKHSLDDLGRGLGRQTHRTLISMILAIWIGFVISYLAILVRGDATIDAQVLQWRGALIGLQVVIGGAMIFALIQWLLRNEEDAIRIAVGGFLLSLVAFQMLYFYISQFSAITATLIQLAFLQVLLSYRRWYLG